MHIKPQNEVRSTGNTVSIEHMKCIEYSLFYNLEWSAFFFYSLGFVFLSITFQFDASQAIDWGILEDLLYLLSMQLPMGFLGFVFGSIVLSRNPSDSYQECPARFSIRPYFR